MQQRQRPSAAAINKQASEPTKAAADAAAPNDCAIRADAQLPQAGAGRRQPGGPPATAADDRRTARWLAGRRGRLLGGATAWRTAGDGSGRPANGAVAGGPARAAARRGDRLADRRGCRTREWPHRKAHRVLSQEGS
ncbi:hypothetical protein PLESTF_000461600 [Pleodorina starrii]|nr:hypothetical protein PLESTF_000461600 [Pleodorina starrii]